MVGIPSYAFSNYFTSQQINFVKFGQTVTYIPLQESSKPCPKSNTNAVGDIDWDFLRVTAVAMPTRRKV